MKRLVLALLLFIFKELAVAPALTPEAALLNKSDFG
ncbi:type IV pilus protein [Klebsiella pneumoniae]|nr:type IV pilus protein [Klebsiella pneumoniae]